MGELVYNLQVAGEIDIAQCKGMCDEIMGLNNKMRELQIQMQNLEAQKNISRGVLHILWRKNNNGFRVVKKKVNQLRWEDVLRLSLQLFRLFWQLVLCGLPMYGLEAIRRRFIGAILLVNCLEDAFIGGFASCFVWKA